MLLNGSDFVCLSGGADGSDLQWGMCAGMAGASVIHWSFEDHRTSAPTSEVVRLGDTLLEQANDAIKRAAIVLKKRPPTKSFTKKLIQRNYYQVRDAGSIYAVSSILPDGNVAGGTGWAVAMYLDLHGSENCFVFDQVADSWFSRDGDSWSKIHSPPKPSGVWAGVGTKDLLQNGKEAIRVLLGFVKPE